MLHAELGVRAKANQLQPSRIRFSAEQDKIGLDVAIPMILPIACQRMVAVLSRQRFVLRQRLQDFDQVAFQRLPMRALCLTLVVAFELSGAFNRPCSSPP